MASPVFDTRAPITSCGKLDIFMSCTMAIESSRVTVMGNSFACLRTIASGIFGPCAARANMNTVSPGAALPVSAGLSLTVTLIERAGRTACERSGGFALRWACAASAATGGWSPGSVATWSNGIGSPDGVRGTSWSLQPPVTVSTPSTSMATHADGKDRFAVMQQPHGLMCSERWTRR